MLYTQHKHNFHATASLFAIIFLYTNMHALETVNCAQSVDAYKFMTASGITALTSSYVWTCCTLRLWCINASLAAPEDESPAWQDSIKKQIAFCKYTRSVAKTAIISSATCCLISALALKVD